MYQVSTGGGLAGGEEQLSVTICPDVMLLKWVPGPVLIVGGPSGASGRGKGVVGRGRGRGEGEKGVGEISCSVGVVVDDRYPSIIV